MRERHGVPDEELREMTDAQILALPGVGKRTLQAIRNRLGGDTPRKVTHSAADRLWLAGMAMQALMIKGQGGTMEDAVLAADMMLEELSK